MGVGYNPRIVTDGLVLCLDAANPRSAPTTAIESAVVSSVTGSGPSYNVVYTTNVSAARVGDKVNVEKREAGAGTSSTVLSTYTYEITGLDRSLNQLTLTYESDTGSLGDDSPADLPSGGGSSGSPEIAPHDIVSLWIDMKGGNNGTPTNGPTFSGDNGGSLAFDGTDDNIEIPHNTNQSLSASNGHSIFGWCKWISGNYHQDIVSKDAENGDREWLITKNNSNKFRFHIWNSSDAAIYDDSNYNFVSGRWVNFAQTWDGSVLRFYVNGTLDKQKSASVTPKNSTVIMRIGGGADSGLPLNFNGSISSILLYQKSLSAKEVLQNYEATKGRYA